MKYIDEFRNHKLLRQLVARIKEIMPSRKVNIMEVCGTHTQNFFRFGLDKLLPKNLNLISGPGCPVCVSAEGYIDQAIGYAKDPKNILLSFGDMIRVPGSSSTLEKERAKGAGVRVVYSALDSLQVAKDNPDKDVIFLAVGFETTAPTIALSILQAKKERLKNIFFFSALKLIPAAMAYLLKDRRLKIDAFLCPGHVSAVIGAAAYSFIPKRYGIGCCVAGFEPLDILEGIYILLEQIARQEPGVANQYIRVVKPKGNLKAQQVMAKVFSPSKVCWRGLGEIPGSGLMLREEFCSFDAQRKIPLQPYLKTKHIRQKKCRCAEVLKGIITPAQCPLFNRACTPESPYGPCMVSSEGACYAYHKYH